MSKIRSHEVVLVLILIVSVTLLSVPAVRSQSSEQWGGRDNTLLITYSISGVNLDPPTDDQGTHDIFEPCTRSYTGSFSGNTLTISGTVHAAKTAFGCGYEVKVWCGDKSDKKSGGKAFMDFAPKDWTFDESFSVSIPVASGQQGGFQISLSGYYNAGNWGPEVVGVLSGGEIQSSTTTNRELEVNIDTHNTAESCEFTVRVTDRRTGEPIQDASLEIVITRPTGESSKYSYATNENGRYSWTWTWKPEHAGKTWGVDVTASKQGYNSASQSKSVTAPITTTPGNTLRVGIYDDNTYARCVFTVRVWEAESESPISDATLEIRVFFVYDSQTNKAINGVYDDYPQYFTDKNGEFSWIWQWDSAEAGDIWRIDVYASAEDYNDDDTSTHITGCATSGPGDWPPDTSNPENRINVEVEDFNTADTCTFNIRVTEFDSGLPIEDARVEVRVFYVYDFETKKAYNGKYLDFGPYYTGVNGEISQFDFPPWTWNQEDFGDVWRLDVYASARDHGEDDTSIHVTGGAVAMMMDTTTTTALPEISEKPTVSNSMHVRNAVQKPDFYREEGTQKALQTQIPGGYSALVGIVGLVAILSFLLGRRFPTRCGEKETASTFSNPESKH